MPAEELAAPPVIALLRRFAVDPIVAVWPDTLAAVRPATRRLADEGFRVAVWPMLADADGRWLSADNAARFTDFTERLADALAPAEIVLDLEPPIAALRETIADRAVLAHLLPSGPDRASFHAAYAALRALAARLAARGIAVSSAVAAPILFDPIVDQPGAWQARLGTPVDGIAWDHVSPMLYTSILEGWSRGLLSRADARALLGVFCEASLSRFGARAGASLGAVGVGAFGDEPVYRSPSELSDDVAIARAAGIDDLALFELGGVLRRAPSEAWLEAFTATPAAASMPAPTLRSRAVLAGLRVAGRAFAALGRAGAGLVR
ncbi:Hypothetical protein A7982_03471 [Minicystis rosea]|nr:Hypothetical protein A7982_03471 [Minicystis rosea]